MTAVRRLLRDPRNFVPPRLSMFPDWSKVPSNLVNPACLDQLAGMLKTDASHFIVCEPVFEYPGMPAQLAAEIRERRRYLTISPDTDMPGLRTDGEGWVEWRRRRRPAVEFTVCKRFENTWTITDQLADLFSQCLHRPIHHSQVLSSGLKDRRAWTAQRVVVVGVSMADIAKVRFPCWNEFQRERRGFFVKDIHPTNRLLNMGDHEWNGFVICIRVPGKSKEELEDYMRPRAYAFAANGDTMPDAFDLQRLGPAQQMQDIGETMLTGRYVPSADPDLLAQLKQELSGLEGVDVLSGDFVEVDADALVVPLAPNRASTSAVVEDAVRRAAGDAFHDQLQRKPFSYRSLVASGSGFTIEGEFRNVIFVQDGAGSSLEPLVTDALKAADSAGFRSVTLPVVRMKECMAIAQLGSAIRRFQAENPKSTLVKISVVGFYEPEPFMTNVDAMLHRFVCEPTERDNAAVRDLKRELRRRWLMYFDKAEELLRRHYRRSGFNMSLEYEVLRRLADNDTFVGSAELVLYDLRDRLSLGFGAIQGFFTNWEIARQIELGLAKPGDGKRIPLPMSCPESEELYSQSEIGRECLRLLKATETLAAPADAYLEEFVANYWRPIDAERARLESELDLLDRQLDELEVKLDGSALEVVKALNAARRKGEEAPPPADAVAAKMLQVLKACDSICDQLEELDVRDRDTGLSFSLVKMLFTGAKPEGMTIARPTRAALSAAFVKYLYLVPRDRKSGTLRSKPPMRNVYADVKHFRYKCQDSQVTLEFALGRGCYASMLCSRFFRTREQVTV